MGKVCNMISVPIDGELNDRASIVRYSYNDAGLNSIILVSYRGTASSHLPCRRLLQKKEAKY